MVLRRFLDKELREALWISVLLLFFQGMVIMIDMNTEVEALEKKYGVDKSTEEAGNLNFGLVQVVYEWAMQKVRICPLYSFCFRDFEVIIFNFSCSIGSRIR